MNCRWESAIRPWNCRWRSCACVRCSTAVRGPCRRWAASWASRSSAITQIADRLERAGLVTRVAKGADRRVRRLELTERGQTMMRLHEQARIQRMSAALEHLSPEQRQEVTAALQALIGASVAAKGQDGDHEELNHHFSKSEVLL